MTFQETPDHFSALWLKSSVGSSRVVHFVHICEMKGTSTVERGCVFMRLKNLSLN